MSPVELDPGDAAELAELLTFVRDWLTGPDRPHLGESLQNFGGVDSYTLTDLAPDIARLAMFTSSDTICW